MRGQMIPGAARYFSAGKGITRIEPGRPTFQINTEAEARKAVQELAAHKVDIVKVWVDDREGKVEKVTPEQYAAIIDEAHKLGLRVIAHIFNMDDAKGLMRANLDAFAHGVRDKDVDDETVAMFKARPNLVLGPNLPDRGVKVDLSWLKPGLPAAEFAKLEEENTDGPKPSSSTESRRATWRRCTRRACASFSAPTATGRGRRTTRCSTWWPPGCRRCRSSWRQRATGPSFCASPTPARWRRQERRLHRARRQPARQHRQHAPHLGGVSARRGRESRAAGPLKYGVARADLRRNSETPR